MLTLTQQNPLRAPLVWLNTQEFSRAIDEIVATHHGETDLYRMDAVDGLVMLAGGAWKPVLAPRTLLDGSVIWDQVYDDQVGLAYVLEKQGSFILINYIKCNGPVVRDLVPVLCSLVTRYQSAFAMDDNTKLPTAVFVISSDDNVPPEIQRYTIKLDIDLPSAERLGELLSELSDRQPIKCDTTEVIKAGRGLSETEYVNTLLGLAREHNHTVDHVEVNRVKINLLKKAGLLEIRQPHFTLEDLGGLDRLKSMIHTMAYLHQNPSEADKLHVATMRRLLLVGVSGSGKSAMAEAVAAAMNMELGKTGISNVMNSYVGESEANMRRLRKQVDALAPICLWFDEFGRELSGSASSGRVDAGTTDRVHGEFLNMIQELPESVILMAAANRIDELPPEMLRHDRFDRIVFVGFPTQSERAEIFRIHLGEQAPEFELHVLAQHTPFFTGAEIKGLIGFTRFEVAGEHRRGITTEDLLECAPRLKNRVWVNHRQATLEMYQRAKHEWEWASTEQEGEADRIIAAGSSTGQTGAAIPAKVK